MMRRMQTILPVMLRKHIIKNFTYCETFVPLGYVSRIDRAGYHAFGDVNEVNYRIMEACLAGQDVDAAIDAFLLSDTARKARPSAH